MNDLAAQEKIELTEPQSSSELAKAYECVVESDLHIQTVQSKVAANPVLVRRGNAQPPRSSRLREATLFTVDDPSLLVDKKRAVLLPEFVMVDVDTVRIDSRVETYLRLHKIDSFYTPSPGLLTRASLFQVSFLEPVQVIMRDGYWWCIAGGGLLAEAIRVLPPPRFLPMLQRNELEKEVLRDIALTEQLHQPARHQMCPAFLRHRVPVILGCSRQLPDLFPQDLHDDEWARIFCRSPRWFADAKKSGKDGSY